MSELEQGRYDQLIRRVGNSVGPGSRVSEVLSELFPVIDVERVPGELLLLMGTRICQGAANRTGAAAEFARIQLFNPVDSNNLLTVTQILFGSNVTGVFRVATTDIELTTGFGSEVFRDRRLPTTSRPVGQIRTDSTAAATDANLQIRLLVNETFKLEDPNGVAVLGPGTGIEVSMNTVATNTTASFLWRERPAEQSELSL